MNLSIFDPTTKLLIQLAQTALDHQLDLVALKHAADHKAADAIKGARAAVDAAISALVQLQ